MRIGDSSCPTAMSYSSMQGTSTKEELSVSISNIHNVSTTPTRPTRDMLTLSDQAKNNVLTGSGKLNGLTNANTLNVREGFLKGFMEKLFGTKIGEMDIEQLDFSKTSVDAQSAQIAGTSTSDAAGSKLAVSYSSSHIEGEQTSLDLQGTIRTRDGQEFDFTLDLDLSKAYVSQTNINLEQPQALAARPIEIDFDGFAANISSMKFSFGPDPSTAPEQALPDRVGSGLLLLEPKHEDKPKADAKQDDSKPGDVHIDTTA